jgi:Ca2+-binding RTX toxin-like protein
MREGTDAIGVKAVGALGSALLVVLLAFALAGGPAPAASAPPPQHKPSCNDLDATLVGSPDSDRLKATKGRDIIAALGGNDRVRGLGARDLFCGGAGKDRAMKRVSVDQHEPVAPDDPGYGAGLVFGGSGDDTIVLDCSGSTAPVALAWSRVEAGPGDDFIDINCPYNDMALGGSGDDTIRVGAGLDGALGGDGDDRLIDAYSTEDDCYGDPPPEFGDSFLWCRPAGIIWIRFDDGLDGGAGQDVLIGGQSNDGLNGREGNDDLSGGADRDALSGGEGTDRCDGGPGAYDYVGDINGRPLDDCETELNLESETNPPW